MHTQGSQMLPLTEKDLAYLKDQMSWELVAAKKAYQYAHQTLEPECRQAMFEIAEEHQRNLERLLHHVRQHAQGQHQQSNAQQHQMQGGYTHA